LAQDLQQEVGIGIAYQTLARNLQMQISCHNKFYLQTNFIYRQYLLTELAQFLHGILWQVFVAVRLDTTSMSCGGGLVTILCQ
jgi:hypothetical protein